MPGLVWCKRRWNISSDDFVTSGVCGALISAFWIAILAYVANQRKNIDCERETLLRIFIDGMIITSGLAVVIDVMMAINSSRGYIFEGNKRHLIPRLLTCKVVLIVFEVAFVAIATVLALGSTAECEAEDGEDDLPVDFLSVVAIMGWAVAILRICRLYLAFLGTGKAEARYYKQKREDGESDVPLHDIKIQETTKCFRRLFCCVQSKKAVWEGLAETFYTVFGGEDLTLSDLLVGLELVHGWQKHVRTEEKARIRRQTSDKRALGDTYHGRGHLQPLAGPEDAAALEELQYYSKYALAAYGWMLLIFDYPVTGCARLCAQCGPDCFCCCSKPSNVYKDNCLRCDFAAVKSETKLRKEDILYASFENDVYISPYFIAVDETKKTIVLSIRGSMSFADAVTDALVIEEQFHIKSHPHPIYTHGAMLRGAEYIVTKERQNLQKYLSARPGYKLVVTGHSLGAGIACLTAFLLYDEFSDLKCYPFSPPGTMLDEEAAKFSETFMLSVAIGSDIIPRLSKRNLLSLRQDVLWALRSTQRPKFRSFWAATCGSALGSCASCCACMRCEDLEASMNEHWWENADWQSRQDAEHQATTYRRLFSPGRIIHMVKQEDRSCFSKRKYLPVWAPRESFEQILVTGRLLLDHLPGHVQKVVLSVSAEDLKTISNQTIPNALPVVNNARFIRVGSDCDYFVTEEGKVTQVYEV